MGRLPGGKPEDDLEAQSQVDLVAPSYVCDPKTGKYSFTVKAQFNPKQSTADKTKQTKELLAHEQLHFDIGEKPANALRKTLIGIMSKKCKCGMSPAELKALYEGGQSEACPPWIGMVIV